MTFRACTALHAQNDVELTSLSMFEDGVQRFFGTFQSKKMTVACSYTIIP